MADELPPAPSESEDDQEYAEPAGTAADGLNADPAVERTNDRRGDTAGGQKVQRESAHALKISARADHDKTFDSLHRSKAAVGPHLSNVLQACGCPESYPRRNQLARCSDDPCVKVSPFTRPVVCR